MREKPDLQARLRDVPHYPGVYVMRDRLNRVIYVGKARDLKKRLGNYFQPSRARRVDVKTRALIDSIWDFELHQTKNEPEALLLGLPELAPCGHARHRGDDVGHEDGQRRLEDA